MATGGAGRHRGRGLADPRKPTRRARPPRSGSIAPTSSVGRIDVNKGCAELFDYFTQYAGRSDRPLDRC